MEQAALTRFTFYPAHAGGAFLLPCILTRCRAFVLPGDNTAPYKHLQRVLCRVNAIYIGHATKPLAWLYRGFSCDFARSTARDNSPTKAAIIPPARRWRAYTRLDALHRYQMPPPRKDTAQVSTAAYYNNVYKRADHASGSGSVPTVCGSLASAAPGAPAEGSARRGFGASWHRDRLGPEPA